MPWIASYAALVSTVALLWNIFTVINQNRTKLKITAGITASFEAIPGLGAVSDTNWNLSVTITNLSKSTKYIERPLIVLPQKINGDKRFQSVSVPEIQNYPVSLEPGEKLTRDIRLGESLLNLINKLKTTRGNVRIVVQDTTGKEYYSNSVKLKKLKEYCQK